MGAIGAKFYKSANKPPPETTSKESTPVRNETPKTTDEGLFSYSMVCVYFLQLFVYIMMIICLLFSVKKPSAQEHVKATTTAATNNKTVENDGWDDDDADWGSLEDCKFYIF